MADAENRLDKLLNRDLPHAPVSDEERRARLAEGNERAKSEPAEPLSAGVAAEGGESPANPNPASQVTVPRAERTHSTGLRDGPRGDDVFRNLDQLISEVGQLASAIVDPSARSGRAVATDHTGTIEIEVTGDGTVCSFRLRRKWQNQLTEDIFDAAVLEAISNATAESINLSLQEYEPSGAATASARQSFSAPTMFSGWTPPMEVEPDFVLRQINALLDEAGQKLSDFELALAHESPDIVVKSEHRHVTVEARDRLITGVSTHKAWLNRADAGRICEEFSTAFAALQEAVESHERNKQQRRSDEEGDVRNVIEELRSLIRDTGFPAV